MLRCKFHPHMASVERHTIVVLHHTSRHNSGESGAIAAGEIFPSQTLRA